MSLMCHEVRTPLNGCLASAEMLLETPLKVGTARGHKKRRENVKQLAQPAELCSYCRQAASQPVMLALPRVACV
jgi:hypothetical protein